MYCLSIGWLLCRLLFLVFVILGFRYSWFSLFLVFVIFGFRWTGSTTTTALPSAEANLSNENELQPLPCQLSVPLRPIVCFAQHLAVHKCCCAALAPGCYMVGIHFRKGPYFILVGIVTNGTKRAI